MRAGVAHAVTAGAASDARAADVGVRDRAADVGRRTRRAFAPAHADAAALRGGFADPVEGAVVRRRARLRADERRARTEAEARLTLRADGAVFAEVAHRARLGRAAACRSGATASARTGRGPSIAPANEPAARDAEPARAKACARARTCLRTVETTIVHAAPRVHRRPAPALADDVRAVFAHRAEGCGGVRRSAARCAAAAGREPAA